MALEPEDQTLSLVPLDQFAFAVDQAPAPSVGAAGLAPLASQVNVFVAEKPVSPIPAIKRIPTSRCLVLLRLFIELGNSGFAPGLRVKQRSYVAKGILHFMADRGGQLIRSA